jgi:hypothetical protein
MFGYCREFNLATLSPPELLGILLQFLFRKLARHVNFPLNEFKVQLLGVVRDEIELQGLRWSQCTSCVGHLLIHDYVPPLWSFGMGICTNAPYHSTWKAKLFINDHTYGLSHWWFRMDLQFQTSSFFVPEVNPWL